MMREEVPSDLPITPGHATVDIEHPEHGIISIDEPLAELASRLWTLRIETGSSCQGCSCGGERHLLCESKSADLAEIDFDWEDGTRFLGYTKQVRTDRWRVTNWKEGDARRGVYFPLEDVPRILEVLQAVEMGDEFEPYVVRVKVHAHDPDLCLLADGNVLTLESVVFATSERDATAMIEGIGVASAEVEFALPL
jgi:hypothetical protein